MKMFITRFHKRDLNKSLLKIKNEILYYLYSIHIIKSNNYGAIKKKIFKYFKSDLW